VFQVTKKQCAECLFSDKKIVSEKRKAELLKSIAKRQSYFICHKSSIADGRACCAGFYREMGHVSQLARMAQALRVVEFVDVPSEEKA